MFRKSLLALATLGIAAVAYILLMPAPAVIRPVTVHRAAAYDLSPPLATLAAQEQPQSVADCKDCAADPDEPDPQQQPGPPSPSLPPNNPAGAAVEQRSQGDRPAMKLISSFDGLGVGFEGPQGVSTVRNPSDNSLAVGPDHIVQIVNSRLAVFDKKGKVLYGAVPTNSIFKGFGGVCEARLSGDAVVRYDQLAARWLFVLPIFQRITERPDEPYSVCYAVSTGPDPMGPFHRYEFRRKLFPDYPRPAIWPDGYYIPTSTGDNVIQKHVCIVDRAKMLEGGPATEQCVIIEGVNFLNNADIDGHALPPPGAPNIMLAAGGMQLRAVMEDNGIYAYNVHVDWSDPKKTSVSEARKIAVAPYHYLCNGQLTNCVPQPETARRLDAQGDKIMQRLVYRNWGGHESIVAVHSVNTEAGGGGVRWYEFRLNGNREPMLYQQGTYAPDGFYRWMASPGIDQRGNIGIGYSFGGTPNFAGQRFAGRLAGDPLGSLSFHETLLAEGAASQTNTNRWEDYTTTAMDPSDDCTFWYVGDYYKAGTASYATRIGAFRMPGCLQATVRRGFFFDRNHNGRRDSDEPTLSESSQVTVPADPAYGETAPADQFEAKVCQIASTGGADPKFWNGKQGKAILDQHDPAWHSLIAPDALKQSRTAELAAAKLNIAYGSLDGTATVHDPAANDWPAIRILLDRAAANPAAYSPLLTRLNRNKEPVTPSDPKACGTIF